MIEVREFRVYISSTIDDLAKEREAAMEIIRKFAVVKDSYRASEEGVVPTCTKDVHNCHLYVGIIGHRYGWVPYPGDDYPNAKSITELEYDACREAGLPQIKRLIFIRTNSDDKYRDSESRPKTKDRIARFRDRVKQEQQAFEFDRLETFKLALAEAIQEKRSEFHRDCLPGAGIFEIRKAWQRRLHPVCVIGVPGTPPDLAISEQLARAKELHFMSRNISPDDDHYLASLDQAIQASQMTCVCITQVALLRLSQHPTKIALAIRMMHVRQGCAILLLAGVEASQLPGEWANAKIEVIDPQRVRANPVEEAEALYGRLQSHFTLSTESRLAVPWTVIAPTSHEIEELLHPADNLFHDIEDEDVREQRRKQFRQLVDAIRAYVGDWPNGVYGERRSDWHCFGKKSRSAHDLVSDGIARINASQRGSRERQVLNEAMLVARPFDLDEYMEDQFGSRRTFEAIRDRGGLVLVDELALLHPNLRSAADAILSAPQVAVVSISPCDPAYLSTSRLLGEASFLRVGNLIGRFKNHYDPQCELALNSEERVQRWLRQAIPRMIAEIDESAGRPTQVGRVEELLGSAS